MGGGGWEVDIPKSPVQPFLSWGGEKRPNFSWKLKKRQIQKKRGFLKAKFWKKRELKRSFRQPGPAVKKKKKKDKQDLEPTLEGEGMDRAGWEAKGKKKEDKVTTVRITSLIIVGRRGGQEKSR